LPGGRRTDVSQGMREATGEVPNVMIAPTMRDVQLPSFELQNVTMNDVFQALNGLSQSTGGTWQLSGSSEAIWVLNPTPKPSTIPVAGFQPLPSKRQCRIFPLSRYLNDYTIDDITTAVQTAWGMVGEESDPQLKFHKDTHLLIAVGSDQQLAIMQEVLNSLNGEMILKAETRSVGGAGQSEIPIPKR
jgi:hypothetical protein